ARAATGGRGRVLATATGSARAACCTGDTVRHTASDGVYALGTAAPRARATRAGWAVGCGHSGDEAAHAHVADDGDVAGANYTTGATSDALSCCCAAGTSAAAFADAEGPEGGVVASGPGIAPGRGTI